MTSVLFVCLGNICRSPTAEAVLRRMRPDLRIDSCGTGSWHVGKPPYGPMQDAARARGLDLSDLRARQLTKGDLDAFDLIIAMDDENRSDILSFGSGRADVRLMTSFLGQSGPVPDPYYTRDFDATLDLIEACAQEMAQVL